MNKGFYGISKNRTYQAQTTASGGNVNPTDTFLPYNNAGVFADSIIYQQSGIIGISGSINITGSSTYLLGYDGYVKLWDGNYQPTYLQAAFGNFQINQNSIYSSGDGKIRYATNGYSQRIQMEPSLGQMIFFMGANGTSGSILSETIALGIQNNGNVGIGKQYPNTRLDVSGNAIVSGSLTVSGSGRFTNGLTVTGSLSTKGAIIFPSITSNSNISSHVITYETSSGQLYYIASSGLTVASASYASTASFATTAISSSRPISVTGSTIYSTSPVAGPDINTTRSIFLGQSAGKSATSANNSNFIGTDAGSAATSANNSNFIGSSAGIGATSANNSNFIGTSAGSEAQSARYSNFIGYQAGLGQPTARYSNIIGYNAGYSNVGESQIGQNNIIIGTSITLPPNTIDSINIGGVIFGKNTYSIIDEVSSGSAQGNIGINVVDPYFTLDVSGSGNYTNGLTVTSSLNITGSTTHKGNITVTGSLFVTQSYISKVDYIDFTPNKYDTVTPGTIPTHTEGRLFYDTGSQTLCMYNNEADVTLNIGQESWLRARNQTGVTITNGSVVRINGAVGNRPSVALAQSTDQIQNFATTNDIIGMATHDIEQGTDGFITTFGLVNGVNTAGFTAGDLLWVSQSAGQYTNIAPSAPYDKSFVGVVTRANVSNGSIFVSPQQPLHFHDISSVSQSGNYTQGDIWMFRASGSSGVWTNTKQLSGSYTITGSLKVSGSSTFTNIGPAIFSGSVTSIAGFTGSLQGTSSWSQTASVAPNYVLIGTSGTTSTISGSLIVNQNLTVLGSSSIQYVTSSQLNVGTNLITVNTATPAIRFGGLAVYDSGSTGTGLTGSLLWDSESDVWIYSNPSGAAYDGAMMLVGPRNSTGLGNEVGINSWYAAIGNGSHHMTSSVIYNSGSLIRLETHTQVTGALYVKEGITGSLFGTSSWSQTASMAPDYVLNSSTSSFITSSQTASFVQNSATSSFVTTSSFNTFTSSVVVTSSFNSFTSSVLTTGSISIVQRITGSISVSGSSVNITGSLIVPSITGSLFGTASYVTGSIFSSQNLALSSSLSLTASYINPTFISASAAAAGFGSGGGSSQTLQQVIDNSVVSNNIIGNVGAYDMLSIREIDNTNGLYVYGANTAVNKSVWIGTNGTTSTAPSTAIGVSDADGFQLKGLSAGALANFSNVLIYNTAGEFRYVTASVFSSATAGVTSITAGTGISVNQSTGDVTITNTGTSTGGITQGQVVAIAAGFSNLF